MNADHKREQKHGLKNAARRKRARRIRNRGWHAAGSGVTKSYRSPFGEPGFRPGKELSSLSPFSPLTMTATLLAASRRLFSKEGKRG